MTKNAPPRDAYCRQVHLENERAFRYADFGDGSAELARHAAVEIDGLLAKRLTPSAYLEQAPSIQEIAAIIKQHCFPASE